MSQEDLNEIYDFYKKHFRKNIDEGIKTQFQETINENKLSKAKALERLNIFKNDLYLLRSTTSINRIFHLNSSLGACKNLRTNIAQAQSSFDPGIFRVENLGENRYFFKNINEIKEYARTPEPVAPEDVTPDVTPEPVALRPVTPDVTPEPVALRPVTPDITPKPVALRSVTPEELKIQPPFENLIFKKPSKTTLDLLKGMEKPQNPQPTSLEVQNFILKLRADTGEKARILESWINLSPEKKELGFRELENSQGFIKFLQEASKGGQ